MLIHLRGVKALFDLFHEFGCFDAGATRSIRFAVVMKLRELGVVVETGSGSGGLLQEHHPDGEIRNHCPSDRSFGRELREIVELCRA